MASDDLPRRVERAPERDALFETTSHISAGDRLHRRRPGRDGLGRTRAAGAIPASIPFTRGVQPTMYRGRLWTMRQYAGFGTAEESNARYRYLLEQGQTGLSVAFDLPTQMGRDSDHPLARGEVGQGRRRHRLARRHAHAVRRHPARQGLDVDDHQRHGADPAGALRRGRRASRASPPAQLRGTIQNDILKEYIARGTYIYPAAPVAAADHRHLRLLRDARCRSGTPSRSAATTSARPAATAVQEVAFTLADGIAYVRGRARRPGSTSTSSRARLSFFFNAHNNLLEEVAKFRAARRLWARIMRERFGARDPRSLMLRFHTQTAGITLHRAAAD